MFLKRVVFVNWGNVPHTEFELGPVNLLSGANGSGKTTAADAIQTVMTAAHETLFHYNPGQEETTQRGRGGKRVRTLASYVLGCDDGSYARTERTDGYIAAVFHPTQGEDAELFTAVIGVRAWLDQSGKQSVAREEEISFFVLPGVALDLTTFVRERGDAVHVVRLDELQQALITRHGKRAVESYGQHKRAYLRRLYGALRGKRESVPEREAMAAARAFSRFMAYKPVSSIHQFVAEEVLERKDLGEAIRNVSGQLKTIHGMERDAQALKDSAQLLEQAGHHAQGHIETWMELQTLAYTQAKAGYETCQTRYLKIREVREAVERALIDNQSEIDLLVQRYDQLRNAIISLEAQRQGIPALQRKDALDKERVALNERLARTALQLLKEDHKLQQNLRHVRELGPLLATPTVMSELPQLTGMDVQRLVSDARATDKASDLDLPGILQRDLTGDLAMLEQHLDEARAAQRIHTELAEYWHRPNLEFGRRRDTLAEAHHRRRLRYEQLSNQYKEREQEIARLEAKQTAYPAYVERALAAIRAQCPEADARVLCDYVEVTDMRWQSAIEGYIGGARFGIIVDAEYEARAIRIVRGLATRDNRVRVVQGAKALRDAARVKLLPESIIHVLKFTHAIAQAYLIASYGSVVQVENAEELRQTARGITADGMGSGSYAMFRCDIADADLVFGAQARERALRAKRADAEQLTLLRQEANERMQESTRLLTTVDQLQQLTYADLMTEMVAMHRDLRRVERLLEQLDLTSHASLVADLARLKAEEQQLLERERSLLAHAGELRERVAGFAKQLQRVAEEKEAAQEAMTAAEHALHAVHAVWPEFDLEARLAYADQEAKSLNAERVERERQELERRIHKCLHDLDGATQQHNQKCRSQDAIVFTAFTGNFDAALFKAVCELRREIDRIYNILKNNVLVERHEKLKDLKLSFNNAFVSHLCQEIHQSLQDGKRQLDLLNKELVNHRFGSDRERFRFAQDWVPEYREYARFFEEVIASPAAGEGATLFDATLSPKSAQVRDDLMMLLLGAEEQKSLRELERIADYRHYHRYEIYKEVEGKQPIPLSEYGTGSGGQLETPAYIIRAASITSALRYAEGTNHLRMVLVDEAFSKMDESRSREVIDYLTHALGLQLIFIMPTSKCGPFMDLVSNEFVFAKIPSAARGQLHTRVLVDRKRCNQERIAELWTRHRRTVHQQAELEFMSEVLDEARASS